MQQVQSTTSEKPAGKKPARKKEARKANRRNVEAAVKRETCLLYTSPSPRD